MFHGDTATYGAHFSRVCSGNSEFRNGLSSGIERAIERARKWWSVKVKKKKYIFIIGDKSICI